MYLSPFRCLIATVVLGWLAGWCGLAEGASGNVHRTAAKGLSLIVDTRGVDGFGYRPVRVTVTPLVATTADQTVTVEFLTRRQFSFDYDLRVAQDIEIPAGSGPVDVTLSVPQYLGWSSYSINVLVDGELQEKLCTPWTAFAGGALQFEDCLPVILVVGDKPPDTRKLATSLSVGEYYQNNRRLNITGEELKQGIELPTAMSRPMGELSSRWIDYSSLDVVCLSVGQLQQMAEEHPATLRAVLDWTAAGGNLWVHGVGADWQRLGELEGVVGLPPGADAAGDRPQRRWTESDKKLYGRPVRRTWFNSTGVVEEVYVDGSGERKTMRRLAQALQSPREDAPMPERPHFLARGYGLGLIVAFAEDPFPGTPVQWDVVMNTVGSDRWLWSLRHGVSMVQNNPDYWNFLIPGVGLAPVTEFCVLITLFVLAIGPLNYWLLRRWRRLYLLVVTTPLSAAIVTFVLFTYALVADGLGTRVRVRSVTQVDQRRGQAVCWARLSYYSGLAPGRGLTFPEDVAVLPLEEMPAGSHLERPLRRELIWEDGQWLASGWLSSRTPTQYLTVRSRPSNLGLEPIPAAGASERLRVKNRLDARIKQLAVCTVDGKCYWATDVDEGATVMLAAVEPEEARTRLRVTYSAHRPEVPEGMDRRSSGGLFGVSRRQRIYNYRWIRGNSMTTGPTQRTGRLEQTLAPLGTPGGADESPLAPGSYVAIVEESPEVVLGIPSAREEASYHVIVGKW